MLQRSFEKLRARREAGEKGFTLIELLIVIVVLGILAGVVIFALGGVTGKSQLAACQADGATLSTSVAAFKAENPSVTPTSAVLLGTTEGGPYVQSWPSSSDFAFTFSSGALQVAKVTNGVAGAAINYTGAGSCSTVGA